MERHLIASLMLGTVALLGTAAAKAGPQYDDRYYGNGQTVRCESPSNRYRECPMDTRGGVQLTRQLSSTRCEEGRNWGQGRNGVWVDRGCRAEFTSGRGGWGNGGGWSGNGQRIRCESDKGRTRTCSIPARADVRLVRQLSSSRCVEGQTWGQDRNGLWVTQGCRGEFEVYGRGNGGGWGNNGGNAGRTFRCESDNGRTRTCAVDGRRVELVRQLSSSACIEGRTWGRDNRGVWVTSGCRAEFRTW
ncbi:DUF3011 domain-containing protein [Pseudoxanthomonas japonensis]|jgi:hypothetical protein|uniref:DUF3011 domain-containing protein n=1 Tax=Pseudoxanthomonas japonensis TaxID=69284 RepID=UPI001BCFDDA2|nr:DUF3011 domain-containing protein [Pseudoxanthomonas japonensis]